MKIKINVPIIVLKEETNENIRKKNIKQLYLLADSNDRIFEFTYNGEQEIKKFIREKLKKCIDLNKEVHLEQVYTLCESYYYKDDCINIIYLCLTNAGNIKNLKNNKMLPFNIDDESVITINQRKINYKTIQKVVGKNIEYIHKVEIDNKKIEKDIVMLITAFKYLKSRVLNTDIIFKLLPEKFVLEDVRDIYEKITSTVVDKSNFRKKIMQYCKKTDEVSRDRGYRPTNLFTFEIDLKDVWI